jgi:hypothetical protein
MLADGPRRISSCRGRRWKSGTAWSSKTHKVGKLRFEEYLGWVVFYHKRPFTQDQFRRFMFAQSKPYARMIDLVAQLKIRYGLKVAVVSNESREVNGYRIRKFKLDRFVDVLFPLASFTSASPMWISFGLRGTSPRRQRSASSTSKIIRRSFRSRRAWGFEAFCTRILSLPAQDWRHSDCVE